MKDLTLKIFILFLIGALESAVGVPILFLGLFLLWSGSNFGNEDKWFYLIWIVAGGLILGIFWQFPLWVAVFVCYLLDLVNVGAKNFVFSKLLRVLFLAIPFSVFMILWLRIDFGWRVIIYAGISVLILFVSMRRLGPRFNQKYL